MLRDKDDDDGGWMITIHMFPSLSRDLSVNGMLPRLSDLLFYTIAEGQESISVHKFTTVRYALKNG